MIWTTLRTIASTACAYAACVSVSIFEMRAESNCLPSADDDAFGYNGGNCFRALALPQEIEQWSL